MGASCDASAQIPVSEKTWADFVPSSKSTAATKELQRFHSRLGVMAAKAGPEGTFWPPQQKTSLLDAFMSLLSVI